MSSSRSIARVTAGSLLLLADVALAADMSSALEEWLAAEPAAIAAAAGSRPLVRLEWVDPTGALPCPFAEIVHEVARIFEPLGLAVAWRIAAPGQETTPSDLHVILLDADRGENKGWAMGLTRHDPGTLRALWVLLPNVKLTLGLDPTRRRPVAREDAHLLARALGRVVAHEVVHALAPGLRHADRGLMAERLSRADLIAASLALDTVSVRAVLAGAVARAGGGQQPAASAAGLTPAQRAGSLVGVAPEDGPGPRSPQR